MRLVERARALAARGGYEAPGRPPGALRLDSNENLAVPAAEAARLAREAAAASDPRLYPEEPYARLARAAAAREGVPEGCICIGGGSDQILDLVVCCVLRGERVARADPTFSFFVDRCRLHGVRTIRVPFSDSMELDPRALARSGAGAAYLDVPNNPTGFAPPRAALEEAVRALPGPFVVDEAYSAFSSYTMARMAASRDDLIVLKSLSKAHGLAGARVGYMVACEEFASAFRRSIQHPYPVSAISADAAAAALSGGAADAAAREVRSERARVHRGLRGLGLEAFESQANFVLFDAGGAHRAVHRALAEQGISVRLIGRVGRRSGCLRATIGAREDNSRLLTAVRDIMR